MRRLLLLLPVLFWSTTAFAQQEVIVNYRASATTITEVSPSNPLPVTGTASGTPVNTNITQILGAARA